MGNGFLHGRHKKENKEMKRSWRECKGGNCNRRIDCADVVDAVAGIKLKVSSGQSSGVTR